MAWPKPWHKQNIHGLVNIHTITHLFTLALTNSTCLHCFTPSLLQETFHHSPSLITTMSCSLSIYKLNHAVRDTGILTKAYSMMISLTPKWINSGQNGWETKTTSITHWNGRTKRSKTITEIKTSGIECTFFADSTSCLSNSYYRKRVTFWFLLWFYLVCPLDCMVKIRLSWRFFHKYSTSETHSSKYYWSCVLPSRETRQAMLFIIIVSIWKGVEYCSMF